MNALTSQIKRPRSTFISGQNICIHTHAADASSRLSIHHETGDMGNQSTEVLDDTSMSPDIPKPKRPRTAYNLFFKDQQEKINQMKLLYKNKSVNAAAIVSVCWKELSPSVKAKYHEMAADDKFRYYEEKSNYEKYMESIKAEAMSQQSGTDHGKGTKATSRDLCDDVQSDDEVRLSQETDDSCQRRNQSTQVSYSPYSCQSIARLASQLDKASIDFLIKALK